MAKKLIQKDVIERIKEIHGEKYDLSRFIYKNKRTKFELICSIHGSFFTSLDQVMRGQGCSSCGNSQQGEKNRTSYEDFLIQANLVHNFKYTYNSNSYTKISSKVNITCPIHGDFSQMADAHIRQKQGCPECGRISQIEKRRLSINDFIKGASKVHNNKYDYSKVDYINSHSKIKVNCPIHGVFYPSPDNHLNGSGCPSCSIEKVHEGQKKTLEQFIIDSSTIHGDKFDYSKVIYNGGKKQVIIICPNHGEFKQTPNSHQRGAGCPKCLSSRGETMVRLILDNNNIEHEEQKTFENLVYYSKLKCDFFLPKFNTVIEFNGLQHYEPISVFGGIEGFKKNKKRDLIKYEYLKKNDINLIVVRYDTKNIEEYLFEKLRSIQ